MDAKMGLEKEANADSFPAASASKPLTLLSATLKNVNAADFVPADRLIAFDNSGSIQMPAGEKMAWILAFALLLVVATIGNSIVTWFIIGKCFLVKSAGAQINVHVFAARRRLTKAYNCFMLSLTLADFAMLYLECVFNFIYILEG